MEIILTALAVAGIATALVLWAALNRARAQGTDLAAAAEQARLAESEAREARIRAETEVTQLRAWLTDKDDQIAKAGTGKEKFETVEKALAAVKTTVEQVQASHRAREEAVSETLARSREQGEKVFRTVERLSGRFGNPKQRGTLAEDWLVVALQNYDLRRDIHFTVQQATGLGAGSEGTRAVLDVYLKLPDGGGIALDAKFPWSEAHSRLDTATEEEREAVLADLATRLKGHIKGLAARKYTEATDVKVGAVWLIVPDWYSLVLAREADPNLPEFARSQGISVIPVEGLAEVAGSMLLAHQLRDWSERVAGAFTPEQAAAKLDALNDLIAKLGDVARKYNSLGKAIENTFSSFGAGGKVTRHVIRPTTDLAGKDAEELGAPDLHMIDEGRAPTLAERIDAGLEEIEERTAASGEEITISAQIEAEIVELEAGPAPAVESPSDETDETGEADAA